MIQYQLSSSLTELKEIVLLQQQNLPLNISAKEKNEQGFVSAQHTVELLKKMQNAHPHIIAKHKNRVIGYALCMTQKFRNEIPLLTAMFSEADATINSFKNPVNYIVMGQICISKAYRKQGIFRGLYHTMKENVSKSFNAIITEVDATNIRSSKAHKAIGFEELKKYVSDHQEWELIILHL